jgi:hypothetical protein
MPDLNGKAMDAGTDAGGGGLETSSFGSLINKLLNKLPLILLCTIRIGDSLFDCRVLP